MDSKETLPADVLPEFASDGFVPNDNEETNNIQTAPSSSVDPVAVDVDAVEETIIAEEFEGEVPVRLIEGEATISSKVETKPDDDILIVEDDYLNNVDEQNGESEINLDIVAAASANDDEAQQGEELEAAGTLADQQEGVVVLPRNDQEKDNDVAAVADDGADLAQQGEEVEAGGMLTVAAATTHSLGETQDEEPVVGKAGTLTEQQGEGPLSSRQDQENNDAVTSIDATAVAADVDNDDKTQQGEEVDAVGTLTVQQGEGSPPTQKDQENDDVAAAAVDDNDDDDLAGEQIEAGGTLPVPTAMNSLGETQDEEPVVEATGTLTDQREELVVLPPSDQENGDVAATAIDDADDGTQQRNQAGLPLSVRELGEKLCEASAQIGTMEMRKLQASYMMSQQARPHALSLL